MVGAEQDIWIVWTVKIVVDDIVERVDDSVCIYQVFILALKAADIYELGSCITLLLDI